MTTKDGRRFQTWKYKWFAVLLPTMAVLLCAGGLSDQASASSAPLQAHSVAVNVQEASMVASDSNSSANSPAGGGTPTYTPTPAHRLIIRSGGVGGMWVGGK